ncbi:MAG: preprotein translocase subunit SecE [Alphaproteobacteria bacterium]|jgi:preprotein translocase subunit SecE
MKKLMIIGGVLIVVVVGAAALLFAGLDDLVKTAVEKGGSRPRR